MGHIVVTVQVSVIPTSQSYLWKERQKYVYTIALPDMSIRKHCKKLLIELMGEGRCAAHNKSDVLA